LARTLPTREILARQEDPQHKRYTRAQSPVSDCRGSASRLGCNLGRVLTYVPVVTMEQELRSSFSSIFAGTERSSPDTSRPSRLPALSFQRLQILIIRSTKCLQRFGLHEMQLSRHYKGMRDLPKLLVLKRFKPSRKHELVVGSNPCNAHAQQPLKSGIRDHQLGCSLPYR